MRTMLAEVGVGREVVVKEKGAPNQLIEDELMYLSLTTLMSPLKAKVRAIEQEQTTLLTRMLQPFAIARCSRKQPKTMVQQSQVTAFKKALTPSSNQVTR